MATLSTRRSTLWKARLLAVTLIGGLPIPSTAAIVFQSGFEEGSKAIWDDYDGNPDETNLIMTDPGPFNQPGNHVMRLRVPAGRGGADLVKVLPSTHDKLYLRWYQKWEEGYNFSAPNHGSGLHAGDRASLGRSDYRPNGNDYFNSYLEPLNGRLNLYTYYRGMYQNCADPNGSCWGDGLPCYADQGQVFCTNPEHRPQAGKVPPVLQTRQWYCLEMMVDSGTAVSQEAPANGVQNFWINDVEYGPFQRLWHRTATNLKLSILWMNLFHHDATHSVAGILLDDIVVSTERVGCGTPPGVQVPPTAPANLRATP